MGEIFAVGANVAVPGSRFCFNRFKFQSPRFRGWGWLGHVEASHSWGEGILWPTQFQDITGHGNHVTSSAEDTVVGPQAGGDREPDPQAQAQDPLTKQPHQELDRDPPDDVSPKP